MTKWQLFDSMCNRKPIMMTINPKDKTPVTGIVNSIQAEDGGGHNFIVTLSTGDKRFVRTVD